MRITREVGQSNPAMDYMKRMENQVKEVGHTPGPWTCHSGMVWKDGPDVHPKGDSDGVPIAYMHREPGNGTMPVERDANARLIAAAPELLELAKHILALETDPYLQGHPEWEAFLNEAKALTNKVEGRD